MAEGLNRVMLLGTLGADPDLRSTSGGTMILKLRLATTERYQDKSGVWQDKSEWHSVTCFGKRAEALHKILQKGSRIFVEGSLHTSSWEDKEGNKRYRTEVNAAKILLCGGKAEGGKPARQQKPAEASEAAGAVDDYPVDDSDSQLPF